MRLRETRVLPFGRWQPAFIAEMDEGQVSHVLPVEKTLFVSSPVMPVF
jgi:hypothetical protein